MRRIIPLSLVVALAGCGPSEEPTSELDIPTVEELVDSPMRLKELREQCKTDRSALGSVLCERVAEATRKRFYGDGKVPYTPSDKSPTF